jgi:quercetin dioxygenase-like cupin family protein
MTERPSFAIFRAGDAIDLEQSGIMTYAPRSAAVISGGETVNAAMTASPGQSKLLFAMPGMSLTHVWFKSGFPLPRHSHDGDCLYYILAGSLRMGTEELGPGDGFLVGADVPYAYTPGEDGVELLEFRTADAFDIKILANNPAFWAKALQTVTDKSGAWAEEPMPKR